MGHGVSTCATCDGYFFSRQADCHGRRRRLGYGGGDFLTKFASQVTVLHRRDQLRASKIMQDKAFRQPEDRVRVGHRARRGKGCRSGGGDRCGAPQQQDGRDQATGVEGAVHCDRAHTQHQAVHGADRSHDNGYIVVGEGTRTQVPGVFACGDVQDHVYRQAITAAGTGCMAALDAERYLEAPRRNGGAPASSSDKTPTAPHSRHRHDRRPSTPAI